MREDRCDCCDLPVSSCGRAVEQRQRDEERARRERALDEDGTIEAVYPGVCPTCGTYFLPGEPLRRHNRAWFPVLCCQPLGD